MRQSLCLRGISGEVKGKIWQSENLLRAGRLASLEIVLQDNSVSRRHAEVRRNELGWFVKDLDSTNGTYVNGVRLGSSERQIHSRDIVQFGKVAMMVELAENNLALAGSASGLFGAGAQQVENGNGSHHRGESGLSSHSSSGTSLIPSSGPTESGDGTNTGENTESGLIVDQVLVDRAVSSLRSGN